MGLYRYKGWCKYKFCLWPSKLSTCCKLCKLRLTIAVVNYKCNETTLQTRESFHLAYQNPHTLSTLFSSYPIYCYYYYYYYSKVDSLLLLLPFLYSFLVANHITTQKTGCYSYFYSFDSSFPFPNFCTEIRNAIENVEVEDCGGRESMASNIEQSRWETSLGVRS